MQSVIKRCKRGRVEGGILQLTLAIGLVISLFCTAMIAVVYYSKLFFIDYSIDNSLDDNASSALALAMASGTDLNFNEPTVLDLFNDQTDTVRIVRLPWGIFELVEVEAKRGPRSKTKRALLANENDSITNACMYVPYTMASLYLVGKAYLKGDAFLPGGGVTAGYLRNKEYQREKYIEGSEKKGMPAMPGIDTTLLYGLKQIFTYEDSLYRGVHVEDLKALTKRAFSTAPAYYFSDQPIIITDTIRGHVMIHSAKEIVLTRTAFVEGAIIIAPDIFIRSGFKGECQAVVSHYLEVGDSVTLSYPSALIMPGTKSDSAIVVKPNSSVEGYVILGACNKVESRSVFRLDSGALLHGMAYINGIANVEGEVRGHITTRSFQATDNNGTYTNYVVDALFDRTSCSPFMPAVLWTRNTKKTVAKWLK